MGRDRMTPPESPGEGNQEDSDSMDQGIRCVITLTSMG